MNLSLTHRLFLSASIVLCLFLGITGLVLDKAFSISLENIVREKLKVHTYALLAMADNNNGTIALPTQLPEQRFNTTGESLIAIVTDTWQQESWRSVSATNKLFSLPTPDEGDWLFGQAQDDTGNFYYVSSYSTIWPDNDGHKTTFVFTVIEGIHYYHQQHSNYRFAIAVTLIAIGILLLALQAIIQRWGLKPVRGLANDVNAMNRGNLQSLPGHYPKELQPLTLNLNLLIDNERRQRERYRDRMADLSHSLKTPLSVLHGIELDVSSDGQPLSRQQVLTILHTQVNRMSEIIDYQLQRAVSQSQHTSFVAIPVAKEVEGIIGALNKVYTGKTVYTNIHIDPELSFYGDENDLAEILGNLLDNAYKHCKQTIKVCADNIPLDNGGHLLTLTIEDDGAGIAKTKRLSILQRGVRLDSTLQGQGFGLAIVTDIINSYQGNIAVEDSALGGALFTITIPAR